MYGPGPGLTEKPRFRGREPPHSDQGDDADHQRRDDKHEQEQSEDARAMVKPVAKTQTQHHKKPHRDAVCRTSKATRS